MSRAIDKADGTEADACGGTSEIRSSSPLNNVWTAHSRVGVVIGVGAVKDLVRFWFEDEFVVVAFNKADRSRIVGEKVF